MVFCIDREKWEKLSDYLSQIIKILKEQDEVEAVFMNSYFIHIPVNSFFDYPGIIDGININLTVVSNTQNEEYFESFRELKSKIFDELNYNVTLSSISKTTLMTKSDRFKYTLNDAEVIFDKTGDTTRSKSMIFLIDKSENSITYEPSLNIRS